MKASFSGESGHREASLHRVRALEKQVQELERLLKRRYPGASVAALLAVGRHLDAASPSPVKSKSARTMAESETAKEHVIDEEEADAERNERMLLESRVRKLQTMLDEQAQESARSLRAMEQKFLSIKACLCSVQYSIRSEY